MVSVSQTNDTSTEHHQYEIKAEKIAAAVWTSFPGLLSLIPLWLVYLLFFADISLQPWFHYWSIVTPIYITLAIVLIFYHYHRSPPNKNNFKSWNKLFTLHCFVLGTLFSVPSIISFNPENMMSLVLISCMVTGLAAGGAVALGAYIPASIVWITPQALALLYSYSLEESELFNIYFSLIIVGYFVFIAFAYLINRIIDKSVKLQFSNLDLVASLKEQTKKLEKASRAKTRFLASASHDLRQPMQAQRLFAESIIAQTKDPELSALCEQMVESQQSMQSMLDTLLDISKLDAGIVSPIPAMVSLNNLFYRLINEFTPLAAAKDLYLHVHWPRPNTSINCDIGLVESILRNLLSNAIRYTNEGTIMLAVRRRDGNLRIEVRDSGIGISEEEQSEIFEEFRQLANPERERSKGLGLGLSIVHRLCKLQNYPLSVYSRAGKGSVFAFELPAVEGTIAIEDNPKPNVEMESLKGLYVLVIDDDKEIRHGLNKALQFYGIEVTTAKDRENAQLIVSKKVPDAIIADYRFPEYDTGGAIINALREQSGQKIPAILLTGDTSPERLVELIAMQCPVLHKPISIAKLIDSIKLVINNGYSYPA